MIDAPPPQSGVQGNVVNLNLNVFFFCNNRRDAIGTLIVSKPSAYLVQREYSK
jgi:hypothetical protein